MHLYFVFTGAVAETVGVDNSTFNGTFPSVDVYSNPTYGFLMTGGTVILVVVAAGAWILLYLFRPDLIEAMTVFMRAGGVVSIYMYMWEGWI